MAEENSEVVDRLYKCSKCGAIPPLIHEKDDKTKPLMMGSGMPTMYAKKLVCGKCGFEWSKV
jgi:ribosomal protein S27AE